MDHVPFEIVERTGYRTTILAITEVDDAQRRALMDLYFAHYAGSCRSQFLADLAAKTEALLLTHRGTIVGFTTLQVYEREWGGRPVRIVYSGDTVVARSHWGQQALAFAWITRMGEIKCAAPDVPLYWFVVVKGHRTYKYLPAFGKSFFPHWSIDRSDLKPLADWLARERFGGHYNPSTGVVELPASRGHLRPEFARPSAEELAKESVRFFLARNPHYARGHELVCLCELEERNMRPLTRRLFLKGLD
jgi:hypothetical protein